MRMPIAAVVLASIAWSLGCASTPPAGGPASEPVRLVHPDEVTALSFDPEGQTVATGCRDHRIRLWNTADGSLLATLEGHADRVTSVTFSPDGTTLASNGADDSVRLWDVGARSLQRTLRPGANRTYSCAVRFSPDGRLIAWGSSFVIYLCRTEDGVEVRRLEPGEHHITSVSFSPDGGTLASADGYGNIHLWDVQSGRDLGRSEAASATHVAYSPVGLLLAAWGTDASVLFLDSAASRVVQRFPGHEPTVTAVAFSRDGSRLFSGSARGTVRAWNAASAREEAAFVEASAILDVAVARNDALLAVARRDGTVLLLPVPERTK